MHDSALERRLRTYANIFVQPLNLVLVIYIILRMLHSPTSAAATGWESDRATISHNKSQRRNFTMLEITQSHPLKYEVEVQEHGRIELQVPFAAGRKIVVLVMKDDRDDFNDILAASSSSLEFWDNPIDDAAWNNA